MGRWAMIAGREYIPTRRLRFRPNGATTCQPGTSSQEQIPDLFAKPQRGDTKKPQPEAPGFVLAGTSGWAVND